MVPIIYWTGKIASPLKATMVLLFLDEIKLNCGLVIHYIGWKCVYLGNISVSQELWHIHI
jgi:hypothetical protein